MRLLAVSDIHIGRIPATPVGHADATSRGAWDAVVRCAIDRKVDAVLLAGDVVQGENAYFEGFGPLREGLESLEREGIRVFGVAGNHDPAVFARIARTCPQVKLLGLDGNWEWTDFQGLRIYGWSFKDSHFQGDPLATFDPPPPATPWLGLLHCDLDGPAHSRYAPVSSQALARTGGDWVLGHIHAGGPGKYQRAWYCGSPFALDAGEEGPHGAWLITLTLDGGVMERERIPLSPWKFRTLEVALDQVATAAQAGERIAAALLAAAGEEAPAFQGDLYCSLVFRGRTPLAGRLVAALDSGDDGLTRLVVPCSGVFARVTRRTVDATLPDLKLEALATQRGPKGSLARLILQARTPGSGLEEMPGLLEEARDWCRDPDFAQVDPAEIVLLAANRLLHAAAGQAQGNEP